MPYRVLVSAPYLIPHLDRILPVLQERGVEVIQTEVQERLEEDQLLAFAREIDGIICDKQPIRKTLCDRLPGGPQPGSDNYEQKLHLLCEFD